MKNKKLIALAATLTMLGSTFTALPAMAKTVDLVTNGTFDADTTGWSGNGSTTWYAYDNTAVGENSTGKIAATERWNESSATRYFLENNGKSLTAGTTYTLTADVYSKEAADIYLNVNARISCNGEGVTGNDHIWGHPDQVYGEAKAATEGGKWETVTLTFTPEVIYSADNLPNETEAFEGETRTFVGTFINIRTILTGTYTDEADIYKKHGDYYVDNVRLTYDDGTAETSTNVAKVGETEYATLDEAITAAAENDTVTVLSDCTLGAAVTKPITIEGAAVTTPVITVKVAPEFDDNNNPTTVLFGGNTTIKNVVISGGDAAATTDTSKFSTLCSSGTEMTIENATIKNLAFKSAAQAKFTVKNSTLTGICTDGWILGSLAGSTFENVTATGNNATWGWCGVIRTDGLTTVKNCTIPAQTTGYAIWTNNGTDGVVVEGTNDINKIQIGVGGKATLNAPFLGELGIDYDGNTNKNDDYVLTLGAGFSGALSIPLTNEPKENVTAENVYIGRAVATVVDGANVSGVTMPNLPEDTELKLENGKLVIAEKTAEATGSVTAADWSTEGAFASKYTANGNVLTDNKTNEVVYGYKTALIKTTAETAYNTVTANVKNAVTGAIKSVTQAVSGITGGSDVTFYIISTAELDTSYSTVTLGSSSAE